MAQVRTVTYVCDSCSREVERKRDLVRFTLECTGRGGSRGYGHGQSELCEECSLKLLAGAMGYGFNVASLNDLLVEQGIGEE